MAIKKETKKTVASSSPCCGKSGSVDICKMIKDRAYFIWEAKGKPAGKDKEIWLQAEKEIKAKLK